MKKILIFLALIMTVTLLLPVNALAATNTESDITKMVKSEKNVKDAVTIVKDNIAVVAIKTDVVTRTQYWELKAKLADTISAKYKDITNVYVTNNPKIFFALEKLSDMDSTQRETELKKLMDRLSKIPMPLQDGSDKVPTPYKIG